jgi:hypothetical protein
MKILKTHTKYGKKICPASQGSSLKLSPHSNADWIQKERLTAIQLS